MRPRTPARTRTRTTTRAQGDRATASDTVESGYVAATDHANKPVNIGPIEHAPDRESRARRPFRETDTTTGEHRATCPKCGRATTEGANKCGSCGVFLPANIAAIKHGAYCERAIALLDPLERLRDEVAAFLQQSIIDARGASELTRRALSLHEYRSRLHRRIVQIDNAIETHGAFDKRGRLRGWFTMLAALIDKAKSIDVALGLARRTKDIDDLDCSIEEYARRQEARERDRDTAHDDNDRDPDRGRTTVGSTPEVLDSTRDHDDDTE